MLKMPITYYGQKRKLVRIPGSGRREVLKFLVKKNKVIKLQLNFPTRSSLLKWSPH